VTFTSFAYKNSVPTSQKTHISTRKTDHIVLFRKIISVYCKNHAKHIIYSQTQKFSVLQTGVIKYTGRFFFNGGLSTAQREPSLVAVQ